MKILRRLYDWVLHWAHTPHGAAALFCISFAESSFFPIPPDTLLLPLCLGNRKKWFRFAVLCTIASVLGGLFGYFIGHSFIGLTNKIVAFYHFDEQWQKVQEMYQSYAFWAVFTAGFTPIPYKVFTLAAGVCNIALLPFVIASVLSRGLRFFIEAGLVCLFGEKIQGFIDRYFNLLSVLFVVLLIGGFAVMKYLVK